MQRAAGQAPPLPLLTRLLTRHLGPARAALLLQFVRFGLVGAGGFVVDTACVYALRGRLGLYGAGIAAYVVAATANWLAHRLWTFRGQGSRAAHHQWALFLLTNLAGFVLNRGAYALMITFVQLAAAWPVLAVFVGTLAGMFVNFIMARRIVFR